MGGSGKHPIRGLYGAAVADSDVSPRLAARIRRDFAAPAAEQVIVFLQTVPEVHAASRQDPERLQTAAFVLLEGDVNRIPQVRQILVRDWRDLLVWAKLGHADWPDRLNEMLGAAG
jgi:hypothetical protein